MRKNKIGGTRIPDIKPYHKFWVIKTIIPAEARYIDQSNRTEPPHIKPCMCNPFLFYKCAKNSGKTILLNGTGKTRVYGRMKLKLPCTI